MGVYAKGIGADQCVQQGMANLVDNSNVMSSAGVAGSLSYSTHLPHGSVLNDSRLLLAAAGLVDPGGQLYEAPVPFLGPVGTSQDVITVAYAIGRELSLGLAQISVKIEPCEPTQDNAEADIFVVPPGTPAPFGRNMARLQEQSFLIAADQQRRRRPLPHRQPATAACVASRATPGSSRSGCSS